MITLKRLIKHIFKIIRRDSFNKNEGARAVERALKKVSKDPPITI